MGRFEAAKEGGPVGRSVRRREDARIVTGGGRYVDDLLPEGCLHLEFVRSAHARGRLTAVDAEAARACDGVVAVFTARDLGTLGTAAVNLLVPDVDVRPLEPLARDMVQAAGQAVAAVVATSPAAARDAAQCVVVEVEPPSGEEENTAAVSSLDISHGDVDAAFADAACVVSATVEHALVSPAALEPRAALADWRNGHLTAWLSTQTPYRARGDLARILELSMAQVRVIAPDVGGAFGGKASIYPEDVVVAWAARELAGPVKWCSTRGDDLLSATQGRGARTHGELALSSDGRMLALRARMEFPHGHWMPYSAVVPMRNAARILPGPYRVGAVDVSARGRMTNGPAVGIYRGAGRPEAAMLMERLVEAAARELALDPLEARRRNVIDTQAFPYRTPTGETLDSGDYSGLIDKLATMADYDGLRAEVARRRTAGAVVGMGVGLYVEPCGQGWESASVTLQRDGRIVASTGSSVQGQGRETAFAQIVAETLSVPLEQVAIRHGDTDQLSSGVGALASRSTAIGGSAMLRACQALRRQVAEVAAGLIGCAEEALRFGEGAITSKDTSVTLSWADVARHALSAPSGGIEEAALTESVVYHADGEAWSSGICLAVVAIDRETGTPRIEKFFWVDDAGVVVNPLMVHGQLVGGLAQGLGEALMERIVYDGDGQLLTGSFMDYALPRAGDMPASIEIEKLETPAHTNPLGAKGVGEAGCIGVPAALYNAVRDALAPFGPCDLQMPLTSEKIWRVLQQGEAPLPGDRR